MSPAALAPFLQHKILTRLQPYGMALRQESRDEGHVGKRSPSEPWGPSVPSQPCDPTAGCGVRRTGCHLLGDTHSKRPSCSQGS